MTILDLDAELARAAERRPFANGFEGESWMAAWCEQCVHDAGQNMCRLVDVAFYGRTPYAWTETNPAGLHDRYTCAEWTQR